MLDNVTSWLLLHKMEIIIPGIFFIAGIVTDRYFANREHEKNRVEFIEHVNSLKNEINRLENAILLTRTEDKEVLRIQYIRQAENGRNPKNVIDTFKISNEEKADIYDAVRIRKKGRPGKNNPYR